THSSLFLSSVVAPSELLTLSLPDALPIFIHPQYRIPKPLRFNQKNDKRQYYWYVDLAVEIYDKQTESVIIGIWAMEYDGFPEHRSEEHTSELQSRENLVCRLLLEKKRKQG